jgi:hypothetical protein
MTDVLKMTKKAFTWSVVAMTIVWSVGLAAFVPTVVLAEEVTCPELEPGGLFKVSGNAAVYLLNGDMERMYFPNGEVYKTWYSDFSGVQEIPNTCVDNYPAPSVAPYGVNYRPGSRLVKVEISPSVYAVESGNKVSKIGSEEVAIALYGTNWASLVRDIPDVYWPNYAGRGDEITEAVPHDGQLVQQEGSENVYLVKEGKLYMVEASEASAALAAAGLGGVASGDVRMISATLFDTLEVATETVTEGSLYEDPTQGAGGSADGSTGDDSDDDEPAVNPGAVTVALAADTPDSGYVFKNSTHNQFTKVNFSAGSDAVTIKSFIVERAGSPSSDAAISGINVMKEDGSLLSSSYKTLNSDHQVTFTEDVVVPANSTVSLVLLAKMVNNTTYSGEVPKLALASVETDATVSASFPVVGNAMSFNTTVVVGVVNVSHSPALSTLTEEVGTEEVTFLNVKIANGSASNIDLQVESIRFNNVGSASDEDVDNLELVVDGNVVATSKMVSNYVTFDLSAVEAAKILNGKNEVFTLRGDIIGGSGRTLDFDIKKVDDIKARDLLNNAYPTPDAAIDSGRTITISRGTLNVSKTNVVQAGNIPKDASDVVLGSWNFKVAGESITFNSIKVDLAATGSLQAEDFTNCKLVSGDTNLTGSTDGSGAANDGDISFTDSFTLPIGDNAVQLSCNVNDDGDANDTVQAAIDFTAEANLDATGDTTGDAITLETATAYAFPLAEVDANLQTVTDLALTVTTLSQPAAQTIAPGTSGHLYTTVQFNAADSAEDIKLTSFEFYITASDTAKANELQNISFVIGDKTLSVTKNGSSAVAGTDEEVSVTLSGDDQVIIPKGSTVDMMIYSDLSAGATAGGTHIIDITSTNANVVVAQGSPSGNDVTATYSTSVGKTMTVGTSGGVLEVSLASNNKSSALVAAGTEVELGAFKFYATSTEDVELDYLYLTQVVTDSASSAFTDYDKIWFVDEAGVEVPGTRTTPTSTKPKVDFADNAFVVDITDSDGQILYLKANLAAIASASNGVSDHYLGYKIDAKADVVANGNLTGSASVEYLSTTSAPTGNTHYVYKGFPSFVRVPLTEALKNDENDLYKFTIAANNADISLYGLTFDVSTTGVTVTNLYLYDVTDETELVMNVTAGVVNQGLWQTVGTDWEATEFANDEVLVSKDEPRTFVLRGHVAGAAAGDSVTVKVAGDAAHVAGTTTLLHTADEVDTDLEDDFIWSDRSSDGAHAVGSADWTNGYLVKGLGSTSSTAEGTSL